MTGRRIGSQPRVRTTTGAVASEQGYVWRRSGEAVFEVLMVVVLVAEACMLALLVWALLFSSALSTFGTFGLGSILVGTVSLTAALLAVTAGVVVLMRWLEARRDDRTGPLIAAWAERWRLVASGRTGCPTDPLPDEAVEALLEVREEASPDQVDRIAEVMVLSGADEVLMDRLDRIILPPGRPVRFWERSRRLGQILDTLDDLARARIPRAAASLVVLVDSTSSVVRTMALRAAARTIGAMRPGGHRTGVLQDFVGCLRRGTFERGALDESLLLLDGGAESVCASVLRRNDDDPKLVASCLETTARLKLDSLTPLIVLHLEDGRPLEVRTAAFRALAGCDALPEGAAAHIRAALAEQVEPVRIQATRSARLLPAAEAVPLLVGMLGDPSWWVRRAAGEALAQIPSHGQAALVGSAGSHPDPFARDMAAQVLRDRRLLAGPAFAHEALA